MKTDNNGKQLSLAEVMADSNNVQSYEDVQKKEDEHNKLKENVKGAGRKRIGKSLTNRKVAIYVNSEEIEYLESLTNKEARTPSAVLKRIFAKDYEIHGAK